MKSIMFDYIDSAVRTVQLNRTRSVLTALGVTIGIASITCVLALSDGVAKTINHQIKNTSDRLIVVRPGVVNKDSNLLTSPISEEAYATSSLTEKDLELIKQAKGVQTAAPLMRLTGTLRSKTDKIENSPILATTPGFLTVADMKLRSGQFLDDGTGDNTAVIGSQLAIDLFGTDMPIGQVFSMRGENMTVIGVLQSTKSTLNYNNIDPNMITIVSLNRGKMFNQGKAQIQQIDVLAEPQANLSELKQELNRKLLANHYNEQNFTITSGDGVSDPTNAMYVAITQVMTAIAVISLVVGGIGIMNIMLVGVAERTREIGIRKAVGASDRSIVWQFLIEALIISLAGGVVGYMLGYVMAFVISTSLYFTPAFDWKIMATALMMALVAGLVFGLYPAIKAARKNTIESLRQYH